jgi:hypothetical protein
MMLFLWRSLIFVFLFSVYFNDLAIAGITSSGPKQFFLPQPTCFANPAQLEAVNSATVQWGSRVLQNPFYLEQGPARVALHSSWCSKSWFLAPPGIHDGIVAFGFPTRESPTGLLVKGLGFRCSKRGRLKHNELDVPRHTNSALLDVRRMIAFCRSTCNCVQEIRLEDEDRDQAADRPGTDRRINDLNPALTESKVILAKGFLKSVKRQFSKNPKYTRMNPIYCPSRGGGGKLDLFDFDRNIGD